MSCDWHQQHLLHGEARLWVQGLPTPLMLEHARGCPECARLVAHEQQLAPLLAELAASSREAGPSVAVKQKLFEELRTLRPTRRRALALRFAWAFAALACIAIAIALVRGAHTEKPTPAIGVSTPPSPPRTGEASPSVAPKVVAAAKPSKAVKDTRPRAHTAPASQDFYPVVMCDSLNCSGPTIAVRVELPASPLAGRSSASGTVMADLLVGEDGLVRGIRLLQ